MKHCLLLLLLLASTVARAEPPALTLDADLSADAAYTGDTFTATLIVTSTLPDPLAVELDAPTPVGMTLIGSAVRGSAWPPGTVAQGHPLRITLIYTVQMPNDGHYETLGYTIKVGVALAARWARIRIGAQACPDWQSLCPRLYLPLLMTKEQTNG